MRQVRYYLQARDKKIIELLLGTETEEPLSPKEIGIRLGITVWTVYRRIGKLKKERPAPTVATL